MESPEGNQSTIVTEEGELTIPRSAMRLAITSTIVGGALEWYDYFIYANATALIFATLFFPKVSPVVGTIAAFGTFAVGQLVRPIGAIILGNLGDRFGRRPILVLTFCLMGVATFAIGVLPTYAAVGVAAPILLVIFRLLQGLGAGAEFAGASIMMVEYAPATRRGLYGSTGAIGSATGLLLGTATFVVLELLPHDVLLSWAWRIPFLLSAILVVVGLYIRSRIDESPVFKKILEERKVERLPLGRLITEEWPSLLRVAGLAAGVQAGTYVFLTYIIAYLTLQVKFAPSSATNMVALAGVAAVIVTPLFGRLSDSLGRKQVFGGAALIAAICVVPYFAVIGTKNVLLAGVAVIVFGGIIVQALAGTQGSMFAEVFSTKVRYSGFAVGREVSAAVFGGLSPLIAAALVAAAGGATWALSIYLICVFLFTLGCTLLGRETMRRPLKV